MALILGNLGLSGKSGRTARASRHQFSNSKLSLQGPETLIHHLDESFHKNYIDMLGLQQCITQLTLCELHNGAPW